MPEKIYKQKYPKSSQETPTSKNIRVTSFRSSNAFSCLFLKKCPISIQIRENQAQL